MLLQIKNMMSQAQASEVYQTESKFWYKLNHVLKHQQLLKYSIKLSNIPIRSSQRPLSYRLKALSPARVTEKVTTEHVQKYDTVLRNRGCIAFKRQAD